MSISVSLIIPTRNGGRRFHDLLSRLRAQTLKEFELIVIDSGSTDMTTVFAEDAGARVIDIDPGEFEHGRTRTMAAKDASGDILIFMTQDAVPADDHALQSLINPLLEDEKVAVAYGRQLPLPEATPFAAHLREFNYPPLSRTKSIEDRAVMGLKAAHLSNSFAAYRRGALEEIGWFHEGLIMGEDTIAGAELLLKGYKIAYVAEAQVFHSHNYGMLGELRRYFDIGVFHRTEEVLIREFGTAGKEGARYVRSEVNYLKEQGKWCLIPRSFLRNAFKLAGYRLGFNHRLLPRWLGRALCMNRLWWES